MAEEITCPNCGGRMMTGFIYDRGHYEYKQQQVWVEGEPEQSFWSGLKTSGREAHNVLAYRCKSCSRLEFYTADSVDI